MPGGDPVVEAAMAGGEPAFAALVERHRRELHVHCYRMTGSFEEAEDLVQETFLRAWRGRDRIELAYLAVIQLLPPRQRAVLILRDVLGWSAGETAGLLDTTVAAANSALQRARATLRERLPARPSDWSGPAPSEEERRLLEGFIDAHERADAEAAAALVRDDIRITMPPHPWCFEGLDAIRPLLHEGLTEPGEWRLVPTGANRQPAAATYLRAPGDSEFRAFKLDVLRVEGGLIAEVTTFDATLFPAFGLPPTR